MSIAITVWIMLNNIILAFSIGHAFLQFLSNYQPTDLSDEDGARGAVSEPNFRVRTCEEEDDNDGRQQNHQISEKKPGKKK